MTEQTKDALEYVPLSCGGELCSMCGKPAHRKVGEELFHDDPQPYRLSLTAYVCLDHFNQIMDRSGYTRAPQQTVGDVADALKAMDECLEASAKLDASYTDEVQIKAPAEFLEHHAAMYRFFLYHRETVRTALQAAKTESVDQAADVGSIEFSEADCDAIAAINMSTIKDVLPIEQYKALEKFVFINQVIHVKGEKDD